MIALRVILTASLIAVCAATADARESWFATQSGSIRVISNDSPETATLVMANMLAAQDMFASVTTRPPLPVTVLAFRDARSLADATSRETKRGDLHTFGLSLSGPHDAFIAVRTDRPQPALRSTLLHEYVHVLTAAQAPEMPAWLDEGLAEFWSASEARVGELVVGRPIAEYLAHLQKRKWMPLAAVLKQPRGSLPSNADEVASFYAQSWAMVHYLLLGENSAGLPPFMPSTTALPPQFEVMLHQYVARGEFREAHFPKTAAAAGSVTVTPMTEARALAEIANMLVSGQHPDLGLSMARRALKIQADDALAIAVTGIYYFRTNQPDQARLWLTRALSAGADNFSAAIYMSLLSTTTADRERYLELAIRVRPDSELAWQHLGALWCPGFARTWLWFTGAMPCA